MKKFVSVLLLLALFPLAASAQSFGLEVFKPNFDFAGRKPSTLTTAWFANVNIPIALGVSIIGDVPFAFGKLDDGSNEDETIGNPAVGLRFTHNIVTIDASIRIPLAKSGLAGFVGAIADIDRQEAFIPDILPFAGMIKWNFNIQKFTLRPYGGISLNVATSGSARDNFDEFLNEVFEVDLDDGELHALYGAEGWYHFKLVSIGAAYNGRGWVSSNESFSKSTINQMTMRARLELGKVVPGLVFRFPFDDLLLDHVYGLYCNVNL